MEAGILAIVETGEARVNVTDARTLKFARSILNNIAEQAKNVPLKKSGRRKKKED